MKLPVARAVPAQAQTFVFMSVPLVALGPRPPVFYVEDMNLVSELAKLIPGINPRTAPAKKQASISDEAFGLKPISSAQTNTRAKEQQA